MQTDSNETRDDSTGAAAAGAVGTAAGRNAGTPPSNTVPATYNLDTRFRLLRQGIDSLYLSVPGGIRDEWDIQLSTLKDAAQSPEITSRALALADIEGMRFEVKGTGSHHFKYVLLNNAYRLQISSRNSKRLPLAYCAISSDWLTKLGPVDTVQQLMGLLSQIGIPEGSPLISRADLFVDFTWPEPLDSWEKSHWITRARKIAQYQDGEVCSGWSIGKRQDISARLYDKTLEIETSGKEYLKALWHGSGWEPPQRVYRLEFEFRRTTLEAVGVRTLENLLALQGSIWAYATTQWLRLCIPQADDSNQTRWPPHPLWEALSQVTWNGSVAQPTLPVRPDRLPSEERLYGFLVSCLSSYMAVHCLTEPADALQGFYEATEHHFDGRMFLSGLNFADYIADKAAEKSKRFNTDYPGVADRAKSLTTDAVAQAYRRASEGEI